MNRFLIFTNQSKDKDLEVTGMVCNYLRERGKEAIVASFKDPLPCSGSKSDNMYYITDMPDNVDCCIVLGGDGTVLQAAANVKDRGIPILGINLGTLGYLAEIGRDKITDALDKLLAGDYSVEERMMLSGKPLYGEERHFDALNDIVITRKGIMQTISLNVYVNDKFLTTYSGDGVIISTPTGSTGYNMSAGGPIVEPGSSIILLTPICPHTLSNRSIVLSGSDKVMIELGSGKASSRQEAEASIDGRLGASMETGDRLEIYRSRMSVQMIRMNRVSFLEILNQKLN
ncbi:NAD(+)/NADH kinase [Butyrivibrio sp. MC2013]|uniref:NAD(+)/NADH kinase n=1 Tax=Butyrivibrio sp. MC2013 TaxID=1280686 RepID=UPI0004209C2F|nr:NAD(+)/NADH kinase [Butyrivibrio sp. MC2013]